MANVDRSELTDILVKGMQSPQPEPAEQAIETETVEVEATEIPEPEPVVETASDQETPEEIEEGEVTSSEQEEFDIQDLGALAEAIEVEPEFLYSLKIPLSDGREPVTLSELKDAFQDSSRNLDTYREQMQQERLVYEQEIKEKREEAQQFYDQTLAMPQEILQANAEILSIQNMYNNFDWAELEKANPGEAALQKQNMQVAYQNAQQKLSQVQQKIDDNRKAEMNKFLAYQNQKMLETIPEWKDVKTRNHEQDEMRVMLREYGYEDKEIDNLADHRAMRIARDLYKAQAQLSKAKEVTTKKLTKMPKVLRPGKPPAPAENANQKLIEEAKNSRDQRVKVQAISSLLKGSGAVRTNQRYSRGKR